MAKIFKGVLVELPELKIGLLVPHDYNFVTVDQNGEVWAFAEAPIYSKERNCWVLVAGNCAYLTEGTFESEKEKELCKTKIWEIK